MAERVLMVEERVYPSSDVMQILRVSHGEDLNGKNCHTVWKEDLCVDKCEWCEALVRRCLSRGGGVCWEDNSDHVVATKGEP